MQTPEELRGAARRAREEAMELRRLAGRFDASHLHELPRLSGDRTWVGPTATSFQDAARQSVLALQSAAADLRRDAGILEIEAHDLDHAARSAEASQAV